MIHIHYNNSKRAQQGVAYDSEPFEGWGATVKDKDGLDVKVEQFADAAIEAEDVSVSDGLPVLVAHAPEELMEPDTCVDGEVFVGEGVHLDGACYRMEQLPQTLHSHSCEFRILRR